MGGWTRIIYYKNNCDAQAFMPKPTLQIMFIYLSSDFCFCSLLCLTFRTTHLFICSKCVKVLNCRLPVYKHCLSSFFFFVLPYIIPSNLTCKQECFESLLNKRGLQVWKYLLGSSYVMRFKTIGLFKIFCLSYGHIIFYVCSAKNY